GQQVAERDPDHDAGSEGETQDQRVAGQQPAQIADVLDHPVPVHRSPRPAPAAAGSRESPDSVTASVAGSGSVDARVSDPAGGWVSATALARAAWARRAMAVAGLVSARSATGVSVSAAWTVSSTSTAGSGERGLVGAAPSASSATSVVCCLAASASAPARTATVRCSTAAATISAALSTPA